MAVTLELIGTRVHPEDLASLHDMLERARADGREFEYEHRLQMGDQSVKYLHLVAHATRDHGAHLEYIGAVQDVTQRRLSETALGKARSELTRREGHDPRRTNSIDRARSQPAVVGHHHQREHVSAHA
ncbi:MAG: hypothetical protein ABI612_08110, partial [Betaproteobacteria bacterium]